MGRGRSVRKPQKTTEEQRAAHIQKTIEYNAANMKQIKINLNRLNPDDVAILEYLETVSNVQGLIKNLIREHMSK